MKETREWDRWDDPHVAEDIDRFWSNDPSGFQTIHRTILSRLVHAYLVSPTERILEVGCGSGLVYKELVPKVVENANYLGVDTSSEMLRLARERFPQGQFRQGDAYALEFADDSFDVTMCFEVLGHLPEIGKPIAELYRVASRAAIFTIWPSPKSETVEWFEEFRSSRFLHREYPREEITRAIKQAAGGISPRVEIRALSDAAWAYVVFKGQPAEDPSKQEFVSPFPGLTDALIRKQVAAQAKLGVHGSEIEQIQGALEAAGQESADLRRAATLLAHESDSLRHRLSARLLERFQKNGDLCPDLTAPFQQLKDDSRLFISALRNYRLQPSVSLHRVPFLQYPLRLDRPNLTGVSLAPVVDFTPASGIFGMEIVSPAGAIVTQQVVSAREIDPSFPTRVTFAPIRDCDGGQFKLRVFAEDVDVPVRLLEWRKYSCLGLGKLQTRAFCALHFNGAS